MTAADPTNKNQFAATGHDLIVIHNTDTSAHTVTVNSVADTFGRTKDIAAATVAAGAYAVIGPLDLTGWVQADGYVYLEADSNKVKLGVIVL